MGAYSILKCCQFTFLGGNDVITRDPAPYRQISGFIGIRYPGSCSAAAVGNLDPFSPPHFARFPLVDLLPPRRRCVVGGWVEWGCGTGRGGLRGQAQAPRSCLTGGSGNHSIPRVSLNWSSPSEIVGVREVARARRRGHLAKFGCRGGVRRRAETGISRGGRVTPCVRVGCARLGRAHLPVPRARGKNQFMQYVKLCDAA